jgi:YgiT-type zinc finger domain-containing protein
MWRIAGVWFGTATRLGQCPNCRGSKVHKSRRKNTFEKTALKMLFVNPYRCEECDERYFNIGPRREAREQPQAVSSKSADALGS